MIYIDSPKFDEEAKRIFEARLSDLNGWFVESFTEADDEKLAMLARTLLDCSEAPSDREVDYVLRIGRLVIDMTNNYCYPENSEVAEALRDRA